MELGWTQKDLSDQMRRHGFRWGQSTVARVETGQRPLLLTEAACLADLLGIERGAFWERLSDEPPEAGESPRGTVV